MNDAGMEINVHARQSIPSVSLKTIPASATIYRRRPIIQIGVGEADRMFNLFLTDSSDDTLTRVANYLISTGRDLLDFIEEKNGQCDDGDRDD
jgi:hypothetical protein